MNRTPLLAVESLNVRFQTPEGEVRAAHDLSFSIAAGESLGIVGESGSGKTQAFLAIMGLLARNGRASGSVRLLGKELLGLSARELNQVRGVDMAMIFQDPMTSLNPFLRVSQQLSEVLVEHRGMSAAAARKHSIEMLERVGIPDAARRYTMYPHEFSGGMRQRVMIAMALLCEPRLLIADEPTTALDVTVQAQILELLHALKRDFDTAIVMITHDLGVVAGLCERVNVMYAGRLVETGGVRDIFYRPQHPYTLALLRSTPRLDGASQATLMTIPGQPPDLQALASGCAFHPRCPFRLPRCSEQTPLLLGTENSAKACHLPGLPA